MDSDSDYDPMDSDSDSSPVVLDLDLDPKDLDSDSEPEDSDSDLVDSTTSLHKALCRCQVSPAEGLEYTKTDSENNDIYTTSSSSLWQEPAQRIQTAAVQGSEMRSCNAQWEHS